MCNLCRRPYESATICKIPALQETRAARCSSSLQADWELQAGEHLLTAVALFQYHSRWGHPRRGSGPAVQALGAGGGGGGHEPYTESWGQDRLPFRPREETSSLHRSTTLSLVDSIATPTADPQLPVTDSSSTGTRCEDVRTAYDPHWDQATPKVVGVILEGEGHIGLPIAALAAQEAARGQDDVLGEGDVETAVALDARGPGVVGEGDVCAAAAQVVPARVCQQPAAKPYTRQICLACSQLYHAQNTKLLAGIDTHNQHLLLHVKPITSKAFKVPPAAHMVRAVKAEAQRSKEAGVRTSRRS